MWPFSKKEDRASQAVAEERATIEDPRVPISNPNLMSFLGMDSISSTGENVTVESALGVPAIWSGVNFLSGTMAGLPLHVYRRGQDNTRSRVTGGLATLLHDAPNEEMSSFEWRKYIFDQVFTHGRSVSFIERSATGRVLNIWPLEPEHLTIRMVRGRKFYDYSDGDRQTTYEASEVIDIPFMLKPDRYSHRSPIVSNKDVIGLAQAVTKHGSRFFSNGGVPPFALEGPFESPAGAQRASADLAEAIKKAAKENRLALTLPTGHTIKQLGMNMEQAQMVELQRFIIEQIARIYNMPPVFLQDLTHGTFSNTEQQDLHFVKHTIKRWIEQTEQEMNLKLFGRNSNSRFVEFNVDGLLRGDFQTRMTGYATAVQNALKTPNEIRAKENDPPMEGGDDLMIQQNMSDVKQLGLGLNNEPGDDDGT